MVPTLRVGTISGLNISNYVQSNKLTNLLYMEFCDGCVELCILE